MRELLEKAEELGGGIVLIEPSYFDEACVGHSFRGQGNPVLVYDYDLLVSCVMRNDDTSADEAADYVDYNIVDSWYGKGTPIILHKFYDS